MRLVLGLLCSVGDSTGDAPAASTLTAGARLVRGAAVDAAAFLARGLAFDSNCFGAAWRAILRSLPVLAKNVSSALRNLPSAPRTAVGTRAADIVMAKGLAPAGRASIM